MQWVVRPTMKTRLQAQACPSHHPSPLHICSLGTQHEHRQPSLRVQLLSRGWRPAEDKRSECPLGKVALSLDMLLYSHHSRTRWAIQILNNFVSISLKLPLTSKMEWGLEDHHIFTPSPYQPRNHLCFKVAPKLAKEKVIKILIK